MKASGVVRSVPTNVFACFPMKPLCRFADYSDRDHNHRCHGNKHKDPQGFKALFIGANLRSEISALVNMMNTFYGQILEPAICLWPDLVRRKTVAFTDRNGRGRSFTA